MVESVGKKLHQARLQRGLTIDEAAHATKLRPDKIAALESDDYSRFANNIYAKGFLQIYGRFLKVDVDDFARTLDNANPISISDYQYLSNAPMPKDDPNPVRVESRRPPSLAPLLVFLLLVGGGLGAMWVSQEYKRIKGDTQSKAEADKLAQAASATPAPNPDAAFISDVMPPGASPVPRAIAITPAPVMTPPANAPRVAPATPGMSQSPLAAATPPRAITPAPLTAASTPPRAITPAPLTHAGVPAATPLPAASTPAPVVASGPAGSPPVKPLEHDFVTASPVNSGDNVARPAGTNVVLVATVKKTKVIVRKDDPKAPPIFEDYVYPNERPLTLKGARFFIEAADPSVVQITKNGLPYAYQPNGGPVQ